MRRSAPSAIRRSAKNLLRCGGDTDLIEHALRTRDAVEARTRIPGLSLGGALLSFLRHRNDTSRFGLIPVGIDRDEIPRPLLPAPRDVPFAGETLPARGK